MGFSALAQRLAQTAMKIAGDVPSDIVYTPVGTPAYDPATGTTTTDSFSVAFKAVISRFGPNELDNKVVVQTDARMIVAGLDLTVEPRENDTLTAKGKTWKVVRSMGVPGDALYRIHIREV